MSSVVSYRQYIAWCVNVNLRWFLLPCRRLSQRLHGLAVLFMTVVFIMVCTFHGLIQVQQRELDETHAYHSEHHLTPRHPDALTFLLVQKIYPQLSQDGIKKLAQHLHRNAGDLLVQRTMQRPIKKSERYKGYDNAPASYKPILCIKSPHEHMRLGNLLFLYASSYSLAKQSNHTLTANTEFDKLKAVFSGVQYVHKATGNEIGAIVPPDYATYQPIHLPPTDVCISGYLQSWRYFHEYTAELRTQLIFREKLLQRIEQEMRGMIQPVADRQGVRPEDIVKVGVHVRRADMQHRLRRKQGYQVPGHTYYYKAMLYFYTLYPQVHFIVLSDDPTWCLHTFGRDLFRVATLASTPDPVRDLVTLSLCDHVIGSVGTYSWWGGWLAGGEVVMYASPVKPHSEISQGFNLEDFIPPEWKLIDD